MTEIRVFYKNGVVEAISADGHSEFADKGNDIVCAGVSTVFRMLAIAVVRVLERPELFEIDESSASMKVFLPAAVCRDAFLLIEAAVDMLREFESQYPKNVRIVEVRS
jgi:uncharacterized protein YsxB (DUF464 family)